jgi:hypothetical protein
MYIAPLTLLIFAVMAVGWWLQQRDAKRDVVDSSRSDALMAVVTQRGLEDDNRRLEADYGWLVRDHERAQGALRTLRDKAEARYLALAQLDMVAVAMEVDDETFEAVRVTAEEARADYNFLAIALGASAGPLVTPAPQPVGTWVTDAAEPSRSWKASVVQRATQLGVPLGAREIALALEDLTRSGEITPDQCTALMAHDGPLFGPNGARTLYKVTQAALGSVRAVAL